MNEGNTSTVMPVQPMYGGMGGGFGNGFGFGGDWAWILLLLLIGGNGWGMGGFGGGMMWPMMMGGMAGGFGMDYLYPWLNNSEHISDGFRDQQLNSQIGDLRSDVNRGFGDVQLGIAGLGRQICETGNSVSGAVRDGFYGAEVAAQGRHNALAGQLYQGEINALNRSFAEQQANQAGFTSVNAGLADAKYVEATEACATRTQAASNTRDIIENQNRVGQNILDKLCQLELDGVKQNYENRISLLQNALDQERSSNQGLRFAASQTAQDSLIQQGFASEVDALYNRLNTCPVPTTPVYGRTQIFTCGSNSYPGCGCNGNNGFNGFAG